MSATLTGAGFRKGLGITPSLNENQLKMQGIFENYDTFTTGQLGQNIQLGINPAYGTSQTYCAANISN